MKDTALKGPPQNPAEPSKRPRRGLSKYLRGKFSRRGSRRVVPLVTLRNCQRVRAARLQDDATKRNKDYVYAKRVTKNAEKDPKNDLKRLRRNFKPGRPLPCCLKISHRHFSQNVSPPKICTKKYCFTLQRSAGAATPTNGFLGLSFGRVSRKRAEYGFGEYGFKHRTQRVFWGSLSFGERTQWVPLSLLFVCQSELTEFSAGLTDFAAELSEFSPPKQYSRNSIPPVS